MCKGMFLVLYIGVMTLSDMLLSCLGEDLKRFTLDKSMALYYLNDYGVPVTGHSSLIMKIQACNGIVVSLLEHYDSKSRHTRLEIGEQDIRNRIIECKRDKCHRKTGKTVSHKVWKCPNLTSIWLRWSSNGFVSFGEGLEIDKNTILSQQGRHRRSVNYIGLILLKDENVQVVVFPNPTINVGSLHLSVREDTVVGEVLYTAPSGVHLVMGDKPEYHFAVFNDGIVLKKQLDYEKTRHHVFNVSVTGGVTDRELSVHIHVVDVFDESPQIIVLHERCRIHEELPVGTDVGKLFDVRDADIGDSHVYTIAGKHAEYLNIDSRSGRITMKTRLDRDGVSGVTVLHHLQLKVTDKGNNSVKRSLVIEIININDNPPKFERALYIFNAQTNSEEEAIGKLTCYDKDKHDQHGMLFDFAIQDGNMDDVFHLKKTVLYADLPKLLSLHKKNKATHSLLINVVDNSTTDAVTAVVIVKVSSPAHLSTHTHSRQPLAARPNMYSPVWKYPKILRKSTFKSVHIPENTEPGTTVLTVHAIDKDTGEAGRVVYTFTPKTISKNGSKKSKPNLAAMYFRMDPVSGNLSVAMPLDHDKKTGGVASFMIDITASDGGTPPKFITASTKLLLRNINDNGPVFDKPLYKVSRECNQDIKKHILIFRVADTDARDRIKKVVVDRNNSDVYSVHKFGRDYILKMKKETEKETDDVVTLSASDGNHITTSKVIVHNQGCKSETLTTTTTTTTAVSTSDSTTFEITTPSSLSITNPATRTSASLIAQLSDADETSSVTASKLVTSEMGIKDQTKLVTDCKTTLLHLMLRTPPVSKHSASQRKTFTPASTLPTGTTTTATLPSRQPDHDSRHQCQCPGKPRRGRTDRSRRKIFWKACNNNSVNRVAITVIAVLIPSVLILAVATFVMKKYLLQGSRHTAVTEPAETATSAD